METAIVNMYSDVSVWKQIDWFWYILSFALAFCVGAIWYSSKGFLRQWIQVFKIKLPEKPSVWEMTYPILVQAISTAVLGFMYFIITPLSLSLSILISIVFLLWQAATLIFRYHNMTSLKKAILLEVGYLFVVMVIFTTFALL